MKIEVNEVFAVEFEGKVFHLACEPIDVDLTEEDIITRGDEDGSCLYFCDGCGQRIV